MKPRSAFAAAVALSAAVQANAQPHPPTQTMHTQRTQAPATQAVNAATPQPDHPYLGMWVTEDGYIRHELLPDGRYDEQRGTRKSAYQGRYWIKGNRIEYLDDTGFTADGEFRGDVFHHGGYVFRRERR